MQNCIYCFILFLRNSILIWNFYLRVAWSCNNLCFIVQLCVVKFNYCVRSFLYKFQHICSQKSLFMLWMSHIPKTASTNITTIHTCFAAVHTEAVFLTDEALGQAEALGHHLAGIWLGGNGLLRTADGAGHRVNHDRGGFMHTVAGNEFGTWKMERECKGVFRPKAMNAM